MTDQVLDALVVGAGPVGLFCAHELYRHGLSCYLIDKKAALSDQSKALGLHIRTLDVFEDCGLLEAFLEQGVKVNDITFISEGKKLIEANFSDLSANRHFLIDLPQSKTEQIFQKYLHAQGTLVHWQTELVEVEQTKSNVIATLKHANGKIDKLHAHWLIACDGAHSTLRKLLYAKFIGERFEQTWWLADLQINWSLPENKIFIYLSKAGPLACFPMGNNCYRIVMTTPEKPCKKIPDFDDIEKIFKERCTDKARISNPVWISAFGVDHKQIQKYRYGRIFFAGDAAHVHSPMGGQGLNTGIQDIYNLGWKLALIQKGVASEELANSYHHERYPIAKSVLKKTRIMTQLATIKNPFLLGVRNYFLKSLNSFAFSKKKLLADLAEMTLSYAKSPIVKTLGKKTKFKAGEYLINFLLIDSKNKEEKLISDITRGIKHHLFIFTAYNEKKYFTVSDAVILLKQQLPGLLDIHIVFPKLTQNWHSQFYIDKNQNMHNCFAITEPTAVLIRPDKYIGLTQLPIKPEGLLREIKAMYGLNNHRG